MSDHRLRIPPPGTKEQLFGQYRICGDKCEVFTPKSTFKRQSQYGKVKLFVLIVSKQFARPVFHHLIQCTCLWLLDRIQLPHSFGLHLHLFERMLGVKELTVDFVWGKKTWEGRNKLG